MNPVKYDVIKFVYDELIKNRHSAGDNYLEFAGAMMSLGMSAPEVGRTLNLVVFNKHETMIRNNATPEQLKDLEGLEKKYSMLINEGYITSLDDLKKKLREEWRDRHSNIPKELR